MSTKAMKPAKLISLRAFLTWFPAGISVSSVSRSALRFVGFVFLGVAIGCLVLKVYA